MIPCNGPGQTACDVQSVTNPEPEPGLTNALFQEWFSSCCFGSTGSYGWHITDVNNSGMALGQVDGADEVHTAFVYYDGRLICCLDDMLYLSDINDNGYIVGDDANGPVVLYCNGGVCNQSRSFVPFNLVGEYPVGNPYGFFYEYAPFFQSIDDENRILAGHGAHEYELVPTPEPRAIVLFSTALVVAALLLRRRFYLPQE